ncbi:MAG: septum formation protein Maf [Alphaproteobacteria bacterium]|nr:septum formation protein Maf [Alphaproteobacteria bacterium]MCB9791646.1 septum formation protein Maf [Alphaproteobacteria bacterium]
MPAPPARLPPSAIVLASGSPWRRALLRDVGIPCDAVEPGVDESSISPVDPSERALARALAKARKVQHLHPRALVIGADQVAHLDGEVFGKPLDADDHLERLRRIRGRAHDLITGVVVIWQGEEHHFCETTRVHVRADLSEAELAAYVADGEGAGCAAGYQAERLGAQLIERIEGDWFNVIGLPVYRLLTLLRQLGWRAPALGGEEQDLA